ncbi:nitrilase family protein [Flavihumibacter rivuli]|uniref:nitrilase family protein n=1 Tax=Flavihumibacter rivuli TaxID=2838156 RepID=UPI001BDDD92F|nr:nitrilase family protein [Flavihumibacter rivuli]ULQ55621.1 nitrilase family protein [Flavihumibacter rivuli]
MSTLHITTIQTSLFWEDKSANLLMLEEKIRGVKEKMEVVVLPEMFSTGFSMQPAKLAETMDGPTMSWMKRVAAENRIILTGSIIIREGDAFYNRLVWMLPNGTYGSYDKRHLFGFAGEDQHYAQGTKRFIASVKGWKINLQVCYDLRFPVWARQQQNSAEDEVSLLPEYDVLINVANWPERRSHAWRTLLTARAIENQCFVVGVNRVGKDGNDIYHSGDSMVLNPMGEVIYHKAHEEEVHTVVLEKKELEETRARFPFLKDADQFAILEQ